MPGYPFTTFRNSTHTGSKLSLDAKYKSKGYPVIAINPNDPAVVAGDSFAGMQKRAKQKGFTFPYLFDADQSVAKAFDAACTPDVFLYDHSGNLFYRGQFDETRPSCGTESDGKDLLEAIKFLKSGYPAPEHQKPAIGCNIKWKP